MTEECLDAYFLFEKYYRWILHSYEDWLRLELDEREIHRIQSAAFHAFSAGYIFLSRYYGSKGYSSYDERMAMAIKEGLTNNGDIWLSMVYRKNEFLTENYEGRTELFKKLAKEYVSLIVKFYEKINEIEYESISKWQKKWDSYMPTTLEEEVEISFISKIKQKLKHFFR